MELDVPVKRCGEEDGHQQHEYGVDDVGWFFCPGRHKPSPWE